MKSTYLAIFIIVLTILTGCGVNNQANLDWIPKIENENEVLTFDRLYEKIITYDTEKFLPISKNENINYLQNGFNNPAINVFTVGETFKNNFNIIEIEENNINVLYTFDKLEEVAPLAYKNNNELFFLKFYYNEDGTEDLNLRVVSKFNRETKEFVDIENTKGLEILKGAYVDGYLYLLSYDKDRDVNKLYKIDENGENEPELLDESVNFYELYSNGNELWLSDNDKNIIYFEDKYFDKKYLNYFYEGKLIQVGQMITEKDEPDDNTSLNLYITDIKSGNLEREIVDIITFEAEGNKLTIYGNGFIEEIYI